MAAQQPAMRALAADNIESRVSDASWDAESAAWVSSSAAWVARSASREATETKWPPGRHKSVAAQPHVAEAPSTVTTMQAEDQRGHTLAAAPASPVARFLGAASPGLISVLAASPIARAALWGGLQPTLAPAIEPVAEAPAAEVSRPG